MPNVPSDVDPTRAPAAVAVAVSAEDRPPADALAQPARKERGGPGGPEPTRFGDWERNGRCIDF